MMLVEHYLDNGTAETEMHAGNLKIPIYQIVRSVKRGINAEAAASRSQPSAAVLQSSTAE